jgi:hypothetical protein
MTNSYYTSSGAPVSASRVQSNPVRAQFALVQAGFDLLPIPAALGGGYANLFTDSGSANTYTLSGSAQVVALAGGMTVRFKAAATNTGASTANVNALGAKAIVRPTGAALAAGDIVSGRYSEITYNATNDNFELAISATGGSPASFSGTAAGTVDLLVGANIASAATVNLNSATGNFVHITGTTSITAVTLTRGPRWVIFDGILTLTHHATNNNLPGGANITTAAGDRACYWSDGTTVYCTQYLPANASPLAAGVATQAQMEAASSNAVVATPANLNWHPGTAKAWLTCDAAGNIDASYNITSITDVGTGQLTVTIGTDFSSANFVIVATAQAATQLFVFVTAKAAGSVSLTCSNTANTSTDPTKWHIAFFGDQ